MFLDELSMRITFNNLSKLHKTPWGIYENPLAIAINQKKLLLLSVGVVFSDFMAAYDMQI